MIDGRNRLELLAELGIKARTEVIEVDDEVAYIVSLNLHRRHLTTDQRASIAAELATLTHGGARNFKGSNDPLKAEVSVEQAAKLMGVSTASVKRAKRRMRDDPEGHEAAKSGKKKPRAARSSEPKEPKPKKISNVELYRRTGLIGGRGTSGAATQKLNAEFARMWPDIDLDNLVVGSENLANAERACAMLLGYKDTGKFDEHYKPERDQHMNAIPEKKRESLNEVEKAFEAERKKLVEREKVLREWEERLDQRARKEGIAKADRNVVLNCLHPDHPDRSKDKLSRAFDVAVKYFGGFGKGEPPKRHPLRDMSFADLERAHRERA